MWSEPGNLVRIFRSIVRRSNASSLRISLFVLIITPMIVSTNVTRHVGDRRLDVEANRAEILASPSTCTRPHRTHAPPQKRPVSVRSVAP